MSIRFGWSRLQAGSTAIDERRVGAPDDYTTTHDLPRCVHDDIRAAWELHKRVVATEKRSSRLLATANSKREFQRARSAEAQALGRLGFDSFEEFAAVHGAQPPVERPFALLRENTVHPVDGDDEPARERADARAERWHAELQQAHADLRSADAARDIERADASLRIAELEMELDAVRDAERADASLRVAAVEMELDAARDALTTADAMRQTRERQRDEALGLVEPVQAHASDLETRVADLDASRAQLSARIAEVVAELVVVSSEHADLVESIELEQTRAAEAARRAEEQLCEISCERDQLGLDLQHARAEIDRFEAALAAQVAALAEATGRYETAEEQVAQRDELISELRSTETEHVAERDELRLSASQAHERINELAHELQAAQDAVDVLSREARELEIALSRAYAAIPSEDARLEAEGVLERARADADHLRGQARQEAESIRRGALTAAEQVRRLAHDDARELRTRADEVALAETHRAEIAVGLLERIGGLERRVAKQRKRFERTADRVEQVISRKGAPAEQRAAKLLAQAEHDAAKSRGKARNERELAREELARLLGRLAPPDNAD